MQELTPERLSVIDELYLEKCQEVNRLTEKIEVQQAMLKKHLETIQRNIYESEHMLMFEDSEIDRAILKWKLRQLRREKYWIKEVLRGHTHDGGTETDTASEA
jgi:hypothetical protein